MLLLHIPGTEPDRDAIYCRILPNSKTPVGADWVAKAWGDRPATFNQIKEDLESARCGLGLVFRHVGAHGVVAFDIDNAAGRELFISIAGIAPEDAATLSWSSGKQFDGSWNAEFTENTCITVCYSLSKEQADAWGKRKVLKGNVLDARMGKNQSVLPSLTLHPTTGQPYRYINYTEIAPLPEAIREGYDRAYSEQNPKQNPENPARQEKPKNQAQGITPCGCVDRNANSDLSRLVDEITGKLTIEQIYNWNGHNWSQGNGKLLGFCPQHGGASGTAFQVNLSTGEWYCHGCGVGGHAVQYRWFLQGYTGTPTGKDFIDILQQLAREAGIALPEWHPIGEPDPEAYAEYIRWEREQEAIAQAQAEVEYLQWIENLFRKLTKKTQKRNRRLRRLGYSEEAIASIPELTIELVYSPGSQLPTPEHYQELGSPKIIFQAGDRQSLIRDLIALGWKMALDTSHTAQGKTEDVSRWKHSDFDAFRLWLFTENSRLPQTESQERNYTPLPVRHNGMVRDETLLTPLGNPVIRWPKEGETANVTPNCYRTELFHAVAEKGYSIDGDKEGEQNPICWTCRFSSICPLQSAVGFGLRNQRKVILEEIDSDQSKVAVEPHISLNPLSCLNPDSYDYSRDIGFWDESSRILKVIKALTANIRDIDAVWGELELIAPHIHQQLTKFRLALRAILTMEKPPYWGWHFAQLRDKLPLPDNIDEIIASLEELMTPDWVDILAEDSVSLDGVDKSGMSVAQIKELKRQLASVRRLMRREPFEQVSQLPANWLLPTLKILASAVPGSLGIQWGKLSVIQRDGRLRNVVQALKFNLFMDATENRADLALALGVSENSIAHIQQTAPEYSNLTILQVDGFGNASNRRSESCDVRIEAAKAKIRELHPNNAIFDHLSKMGENDDAHHFGNQVRGSNVFSNRDAIASFGNPAPNMGQLLHYYITVTGRCVAIDDPEFEAFYQRKVEAEITQEIGRLRTQRRPGKQLYFYLCTDIDPGFLHEAFPGCRVQSIEAFELTPLAATPLQQTKWAILQAVGSIANAGGKLLTTTVAAASGITQGRLSQIASDFGGWNQLKRLLAALYKRLNSSANNSPNEAEPLEPDFLWMAQTYLPVLANAWLKGDEPMTAESVMETIKIAGWTKFWQIIQEMPVTAVAKFLGVLGGLLASGGLELQGSPDGFG